MEKRLKLLESGGQVIQAFEGTGGQKKWEAKAESKGYSNSNDFMAEEGKPYKKHKSKWPHSKYYVS